MARLAMRLENCQVEFYFSFEKHAFPESSIGRALFLRLRKSLFYALLGLNIGYLRE
jgi:hypothetical protein